MGQYDGVDLVSSLEISEVDKAKILLGNAQRLLKMD
jgi:predicted TIM-barrel fold metal-dependent hydrolase